MLTPAMEARILARTRTKPTDGSTHWSTRKLGKELGIAHMMVARVWRGRISSRTGSSATCARTDPEFETKAADIIGLYVNPPHHAAVFCVDEKTAIQALDRLDPVLPLSPGRAERHGFEYYRHGTLSLYGRAGHADRRGRGADGARHTSAEFVAFLAQWSPASRRRREIHIILDNLSTHKTDARPAVPGRQSHVHLHFTPDLLVVAQSGGESGLPRSNAM